MKPLISMLREAVHRRDEHSGRFGRPPTGGPAADACSCFHDAQLKRLPQLLLRQHRQFSRPQSDGDRAAGRHPLQFAAQRFGGPQGAASGGVDLQRNRQPRFERGDDRFGRHSLGLVVTGAERSS